MRRELVTDPKALEPHLRAWAALALEAEAPLAHPEWMLAWWRHAAPAGARLRVALVHDDDGLVGVAPFYEEPHGLRALRVLGAAATAGAGPVARRGAEAETAAAFAAALAPVARSLLRLEGLPADAPWRGALASAWPGGAQSIELERVPAPYARFHGPTADAWLAARSSGFRKTMRRLHKRLDEVGAVVRLASEPDEVRRDVESFVRLHRARWEARGGSGVVDDGVERMLAEAVPRLAPSRLRLWSIDVDGRTVACELVLAAGGVSALWLGGFDKQFALLEPTKVLVLREIEHAAALGGRVLDLGAGAQDYKYRLADGDVDLLTTALVPAGGRGAVTLARLLPERARRELSRRLPEPRKHQLKALLGRTRLRR